MFRFEKLQLKNFHCFEHLELSLEPDMTVFFAENRGGKTSILTALAMGLEIFQPESLPELKLEPSRDTRKIVVDEQGRREYAGPCEIVWTAVSGDKNIAEWNIRADLASNSRLKITNNNKAPNKPASRQPLFFWYRSDRGKTGPFGQEAADTMLEATTDIASIRHDSASKELIIYFKDGHASSWSEISGGYKIFLGLVGDIAHRAIALDKDGGKDAPQLAEGVVLIDIIELHLHPRLQREVLRGLRKAFPKLQFIVTTHSPQVLSSVENRQVRWLIDRKLQEHGVFLEGRDSNSILREFMHTDDRDQAGAEALRKLYYAIDKEDKEAAEKLYEALLDKWGGLDPELIRAEGFMDWED